MDPNARKAWFERTDNFRSLLRSRRAMGAHTCLTLMELWIENKIQLNEEEFDLVMGQLHDRLEEFYNDRYKLIRLPREYESEEDSDTEPA